MSNPSTACKNSMCDAYKLLTVYGALADSSGTELTGGSPAYARIANTWGTSSGGSTVGAANAYNCPAASVPARWQGYLASTGGAIVDWNTITSQTFSSQGTYTVTPTYSYA